MCGVCSTLCRTAYAHKYHVIVLKAVDEVIKIQSRNVMLASKWKRIDRGVLWPADVKRRRRPQNHLDMLVLFFMNTLRSPVGVGRKSPPIFRRYDAMRYDGPRNAQTAFILEMNTANNQHGSRFVDVHRIDGGNTMGTLR